jgi:negative modulator of initiation of replication
VRGSHAPDRHRRRCLPAHREEHALDRAPWHPFEVQRYLYLFRCIQQRRPLDFRNVVQIRGRERIYFARTAGEIEASGKSTQPREIHGAGYWALTNLPVREKERILRNAMMMLQFDEDAMLAAREYLLRGRIPSMPG